VWLPKKKGQETVQYNQWRMIAPAGGDLHRHWLNLTGFLAIKLKGALRKRNHFESRRFLDECCRNFPSKLSEITDPETMRKFSLVCNDRNTWFELHKRCQEFNGCKG